MESAKEFPQRGKAGHRKAVIQTQKRIRRRILIDCRRQTNGRVNCDYLEPVPRTTIFQFPWRKTKNRERYVDPKRQRRGMFIAPRHDSLDRKPQRGGMMRQVPQKRRISMGSFHAAPTELALWDGGAPPELNWGLSALYNAKILRLTTNLACFTLSQQPRTPRPACSRAQGTGSGLTSWNISDSSPGLCGHPLPTSDVGRGQG